MKSLIELHADLRKTNDLILRLCMATERIALALEVACALPETPKYPAKPAGKDAVGTYGNFAAEPATEDEMRQNLRDMGIGDADIEDFIVQKMFGADGEEGTEA